MIVKMKFLNQLKLKKMENTKEITLTLEKAKGYYHSGNKELKELALMFFTEKELFVLSYDEIRLSLKELALTLSNEKKLSYDDICFELYNKFNSWNIINPVKFISNNKYSGNINANYISRCAENAYYASHDEKFLKHLGVLTKVKNLADYFNDFKDCDFGCEINCPHIMKPKISPAMILFKNASVATKAYEYLTEEDKKYLIY